MITPNEYNNMKTENTIEDVIAKIDELILKESKNPSYEWLDIIYSGELSKETRNEIAVRYIQAGWDTVCHRTSSESGERPGLTRIIFLTKGTKDVWLGIFKNGAGYFMVSNENKEIKS